MALIMLSTSYRCIQSTIKYTKSNHIINKYKSSVHLEIESRFITNEQNLLNKEHKILISKCTVERRLSSSGLRMSSSS